MTERTGPDGRLLKGLWRTRDGYNRVLWMVDGHRRLLPDGGNNPSQVCRLQPDDVRVAELKEYTVHISLEDEIYETSRPSTGGAFPRIRMASWVDLPPTTDGTIDVETEEEYAEWTEIGVTYQYTAKINWITCIGLLGVLSRGWEPSLLFDTIPCEAMHDKDLVCSIFCKNTRHRERVINHKKPHEVVHPLHPTLSDAVVLRYTLANADVPYIGKNSFGKHEKVALNIPLWSCIKCGYMYSRKCYGAWLVYGCCGFANHLCVDCFMDAHFPSQDMWDQRSTAEVINPPPPPCCANGCRYPEICLYPIRQMIDRPVSQYSLLRKSIKFKTSNIHGILCAGITLCAKPREVVGQDFDMSMLSNSKSAGQHFKKMQNPGHMYLQALRIFITQRYMEYNAHGSDDDEDDIEEKKDRHYAEWDEKVP
jgi:hypothetical protein